MVAKKTPVKQEPLTPLQITQAQVNPLTQERDQLREMVARLQLAGGKRKEPPSAQTPTRDPRKKPRVLEQLQFDEKQQQRISELEGELSTATSTISKLTNRVQYLENDRKFLKADVDRYRAKGCKIQK
ncbi:hypothetical protein K438DRAFT_2009710 [Mycena galopus ATCC 62051]|nr:hypothetical protein K438DRAFT_2009710 [Mycena galopus ATCC 62051]